MDEVERQDRKLERGAIRERPARPSVVERRRMAGLLAAERVQRQGLPITVDTLRAETDALTPAAAAELFVDDVFLGMLERRGLALPENDGLSAEQMHALAIYMDATVAGVLHARKLRMMGITDAQWRGWLLQPAFAARVSVISEEKLRASIPVALQRIEEGVDAGNERFITMALEMTGRHDRRTETVDVNKILMLVFNVLDEELDEDALDRVSRRLKRLDEQGLLGRNAPAGPAMQPVTVVREVESPQVPPTS